MTTKQPEALKALIDNVSGNKQTPQAQKRAKAVKKHLDTVLDRTGTGESQPGRVVISFEAGAKFSPSQQTTILIDLTRVLAEALHIPPKRAAFITLDENELPDTRTETSVMDICRAIERLESLDVATARPEVKELLDKVKQIPQQVLNFIDLVEEAHELLKSAPKH